MSLRSGGPPVVASSGDWRGRRWFRLLPGCVLLAVGLVTALVFHWWSFGAPLIGGAVGSTLAAVQFHRRRSGDRPVVGMRTRWRYPAFQRWGPAVAGAAFLTLGTVQLTSARSASLLGWGWVVLGPLQGAVGV